MLTHRSTKNQHPRKLKLQKFIPQCLSMSVYICQLDLDSEWGEVPLEFLFRIGFLSRLLRSHHFETLLCCVLMILIKAGTSCVTCSMRLVTRKLRSIWITFKVTIDKNIRPYHEIKMSLIKILMKFFEESLSVHWYE